MFPTRKKWCQILSFKTHPNPKIPSMTKQSHLCVFWNKNTKGIPIQKLKNCPGISYWQQTPNPPPKKTTTNQQKIPFATTNQSHFWPFLFQKIFKRPQPPTPTKTFSHQLFSGNLVPKGRKAISAGSSAKGAEPAVNPRAGLVGFPSLWLVNLCQPIYPPPNTTPSRNKGSIWHYYGKPMVDSISP